jgi:hypothetical protein
MQIVVFAWGPLTNPNIKEIICIDKPFVKSELLFPISLSRVECKGKPKEKLTLVIDPNGISTSVFYAPHTYKNLGKAIKNLKESENTQLSNIGYYNNINGRYKTRNLDILLQIKKFIYQHYFDIAIWTDTPPNLKFSPMYNRDEWIQKFLLERLRRLKNTKEYLKMVPIEVQNILLYKRILDGKLINTKRTCRK